MRRGRKARGLKEQEAAPLPKGERAAMRLLLVDDDDAVREELRRTIELKTTFEVVGEARDGAEAVKLAGSLHADIVLMDVRMPMMDGIDATAKIKNLWPRIYVLALSDLAESSSVDGMLRAGADGYVLKGVGAEELMSPFQAASSGLRISTGELSSSGGTRAEPS